MFSNLPYRRLSSRLNTRISRALRIHPHPWLSNVPQVENLRYGRLESLRYKRDAPAHR
jgi:hypothetical protein